MIDLVKPVEIITIIIINQSYIDKKNTRVIFHSRKEKTDSPHFWNPLVCIYHLQLASNVCQHAHPFKSFLTQHKVGEWDIFDLYLTTKRVKRLEK